MPRQECLLGVRGRSSAVVARSARRIVKWHDRLQRRRTLIDMGQLEADEITHELLGVLNDAAGTHAMATMGIIRVREWALSVEVEDRTSESSVFIGHGDPNSDEGFAYQRWHLDTLPDRLDADGPVVRELGQQWVVLVASHWNDHYRHRIAELSASP